jgi:co-chaperonin GroES (HSP10)
MSIRPTGSNVIVSRIAGSKETESGIILKTSQEPDRAKIIAIGPDVTEVAVDEVALVNWQRSTRISGLEEDEELYVLPITEVVFVYED